jgi:hypothetical protein
MIRLRSGKYTLDKPVDNKITGGGVWLPKKSSESI